MPATPPRASIRHYAVIHQSAEFVWRIVGRPEILHLWFPGIVACEVDGESRVITLGSGMKMPETILTNDAIQRRFQYRITTPIFKEHLATVDVIPLDVEQCIVTYSTDADPAAMALIIGGGTLGALAELKLQCEANAGAAIDAVKGEI